MPRFLNVGGNNKAIPVPPHYDGWQHLLLDIDPSTKPDICCDARELVSLEPESFDAVYCSHNLEHYYAHDVPRVLAGFLHVLKPHGFAEVRVPDLGALMKMVVDKDLDISDVLYQSPAGAVAVRDVLYGFGPEIERSKQDFYAHKTGFTRASLASALTTAGFHKVISGQIADRPIELGAIAFKSEPTFHQKKRFAI